MRARMRWTRGGVVLGLASALCACSPAQSSDAGTDARVMDAVAMDIVVARDVAMDATDASDVRALDSAREASGPDVADAMDVADTMGAADVTDASDTSDASDADDTSADDASAASDAGAACPPFDFDAAPVTPDTPTLARDIQPIFNAGCSCHTAAGFTNPLLAPGFAYDSIVCVRAETPCPTADWIVLPGDPDHSALYVRVSGSGCFDRMPLGEPALSDSDVARIRAWILAGAPP